MKTSLFSCAFILLSSLSFSQDCKCTYSGDGSSGGGTTYNNQKDKIKNAPVDGELKVNGCFI